MLKLSLVLLSGFILGFITSFILQKLLKSKNDKELELFRLLSEFQKTLEDYKNQNIINTKEVKDAVKDAAMLAKSLTTNQNLKGQFGEECLEAIINACFPNKDIDYIKQFISKNDDGAQIKPDYLVKLPNQKSILIDCKLNLEKYLDYKNSPSPDKKANFIKDINNTINNLSNKKYQTAFDIVQPDFILMYIPLEPVITLIYTDSEYYSIIKNASEKNIIIVGNSGILTAIKLTKLLWAKSIQERNIDNIISLAQSIYETVANHSQTLFEMKNLLNESAQKFSREYEKIASNNNFFKTVNALKDYGIETTIKKTGKRTNEVTINQDFLE